MKFEKKTEKHSAAKRLIPAAAMLLASATMLSTATYAWFTMNKQVELTGLNMTATAGDSLEISLASVSDTNALKFNDFAGGKSYPQDTADEKGWKSSVIVGNYYESIGKIEPASTVDGQNFYYATDASNGGKSATTFTKVTAVSSSNDFIKTREYLSGDATVNSGEITGYYVDIPVYLRTSKTKPSESGTDYGQVYCKMILKNVGGGATSELYKAVRVAFIPSTGTNNKIFGINNEYYVDGKAVNGVNDSRDTVTVSTTNISSDGTFNAMNTFDSGLQIPYASDGNYGHLNFTIRVWLEGESSYCNDVNAGQAWNIDLAFSLEESTAP